MEKSLPHHFSLGKKTNSDIKTTPIRVLGEEFFLSYKKPYL